jgi:hypothetical protein
MLAVRATWRDAPARVRNAKVFMEYSQAKLQLQRELW